MKKIILFDAGYEGRHTIGLIGKDNVAFFCDSFHKEGSYIEGIQVISPETLYKIYEEYRVFVTPRLMNAKMEIESMLEKRGIPYETFHSVSEDMMHVYGHFPDVVYEYNEEESEYAFRMRATAQMFKQMFEYFEPLFRGKKIDIWLRASDHIAEAYKFLLGKGLRCVFSYSTAYPLEDKIISIPDYRFMCGYDGLSWEEITRKFVTSGQRKWEDGRAFWIGTAKFSLDRMRLHNLGERHRDKLHIVNTGSSAGMLRQPPCPMHTWTKYKYLIDVRGCGWTDRVKGLLFLGRPILLADRPFKEYYFGELKPMVHYVPVREDLTDLLEKIDYLDSHEDVYRSIAANAVEFAKKHLTLDRALEYLKDVTLKYGVVAEIG